MLTRKQFSINTQRSLTMPGTRTSGAVVYATPDVTDISFHLVDASGDLYSENIDVSPTAGESDVEGLASTYQAASNASLWKVVRTQSWVGEIDPDNAIAAYRATIAEGINMLFRNDTQFTRNLRLIAPIAAIMQGNQDIPLLTPTNELGLMVADYLTLSTGFNLETLQFTGRRERKNNPKIRV